MRSTRGRRLLDALADAGGVDEAPGPAAEGDQLVDRVDVVPATLSTTTRSSLASLLSSEDFPALGVPTIAIGAAPRPPRTSRPGSRGARPGSRRACRPIWLGPAIASNWPLSGRKRKSRRRIEMAFCVESPAARLRRRFVRSPYTQLSRPQNRPLARSCGLPWPKPVTITRRSSARPSPSASRRNTRDQDQLRRTLGA